MESTKLELHEAQERLDREIRWKKQMEQEINALKLLTFQLNQQVQLLMTGIFTNWHTNSDPRKMELHQQVSSCFFYSLGTSGCSNSSDSHGHINS